MYAVRLERSTISGVGAQRISANPESGRCLGSLPPRPLISSTTRSLHAFGGDGRGRGRSATSRISVHQTDQGDEEAGRASECFAVDPLRDVLVGVVPGREVAVPV